MFFFYFDLVVSCLTKWTIKGTLMLGFESCISGVRVKPSSDLATATTIDIEFYGYEKY